MATVLADQLTAFAEHVQRLSLGLAREVAAVSLLRAGRLSLPQLVAVGAVDAVRLRPAEVFRPALLARAGGVVLAHTHTRPGAPSAADLAVTRRLVAAGSVLGVPLLGHCVVHASGWVDCLSEAELGRRGEQ